MRNWKENIATMVLVKQELMKHDVKNIWPHHFPEVGASEEQIRVIEDQLGHNLDSMFRRFLKHANGWKGFYQTVDLFGTEQLQESAIKDYAKTFLDDDVLKESGVSRTQLLPIAITEFDKDLFVLCLPNSSTPGEVIWFAGEEIDRFKNFNEYFLAMIDYNREEVFELKKS
ncbi:SMI1/KNR4 family protein [Bacillus sp. WMMC1349]|uniref:SMI1/KNR4 family protein n=1 Tax=Bacillus sp. WMMC1349 TaxID=2736254 RepID=UPI0015570144|nr:SMI1/KNR4 family protein [Bacillus sp. WMMC1349]NPC93238.1 SMI1/KNR4 family protein [Bacillus sp. WMMC1349]